MKVDFLKSFKHYEMLYISNGYKSLFKRSDLSKNSAMCNSQFHRLILSRSCYSCKRKLVSQRLSSQEIRQTFTDYFINEHEHTLVPSSPVQLKSDPSLLFVNAGMNQFKPLLLGTLDAKSPLASLKRAANSQKCIRVGGKHNDLSDVGKDLHHHTFFEMLGNWSFGDYFKKEACSMAYELLTKRYNIPVDKLYVTYFGGDQALNLEPDLECREIWLQIGFPPEKVIPCGVSDNFWEMGDTGPCGPCTEIHYSYGNTSGSDAGQSNIPELQKLTELWNLVFIQYERRHDGTLRQLPQFHVDTGMGMERITAVLQGTQSNYDTDLFQPIFRAISQSCKIRPYQGRVGALDVDGIDTIYRTIADHARMFTVAISDGVLPEESGAGNLVRQITKSAVLNARKLNSPEGMVASLAHHVADSLGSTYPEITRNLQLVIDTVLEEEQRTFHQLDTAMIKLKEMVSGISGPCFPGEKAWELYQVYGVPKPTLKEMLQQHGFEVDWQGFNRLKDEISMKSSVARQKQTDSKFSTMELQTLLKDVNVKPTDDSYKYNYNFDAGKYRISPMASNVIALLKDNCLSCEVQEGDKCIIVLDKTNFYAEKGGQVSDVGYISKEGFLFKVDEVRALQDYVLHQGSVQKGHLTLGDAVCLNVNEDRRLRCMQNHTATHLLNAVLHQILPQTSQQSSYVGEDYLRFSFTAKNKLTKKDIEKIERLIKQAIKEHCQIKREDIPLCQALENPEIITLPEELYPDPVTLITISSESSLLPSRELCCGTHLHNTEHIKDFMITGHKSLSQLIKSVQAVTGDEVQHIQTMHENIEKQVNELENYVSDWKNNKRNKFGTYSQMTKLLQDVRDVRTALHQITVGLNFRLTIEERLELLEKTFKNNLKQYHETVVKKQVEEELTKSLSSSNLECIIHKLQVEGDFSSISGIATRMLTDRPYFLIHSKVQKYVPFTIGVPQKLVTPGFNAELWLQALSDVMQVTRVFYSDDKCFCRGSGIPLKPTDQIMHVARSIFNEKNPQ